MSGFNRPCLGCGKLQRNGSRCETCQAGVDATRDAKRGPRPHYKGDWPKIAKAAIAAHPYCHVCGSQVDLTADHVKPRSLEAGIRVLCRRHNSAKGAR